MEILMSEKIKNDMVVKSNKLITASYYLTLNEMRLLDLALAELTEYEECEKKLTTMPQFVEIRAEDYSKAYDMPLNQAYDAMRDASEQLFMRYFTYQVQSEMYPSHKEQRKARWVQEIGYVKGQGLVALSFTHALIELAGKLKGSFSRYHLEQKAPLTSIYAHRLYEMMMQWRGSKNVPYLTYCELRNRFDIADDEYNRVANFKARVLDPAIKQINELTDIIVSYEQYKKGRSIEGFTFKFKFKDTKKDKDTDTSSKDTKPSENKQQPSNKKIRTIPPLSDKQRNTFANKLLNNFEFIRDFSRQTIGKSREQLVTWIEQELADDEKRQKLSKYLVMCGYEYPERHKK